MKVQKRRNVILDATQLLGDGCITTSRGDELRFDSGDYLLTTKDGEQWPVTEAYFLENYEIISGDGHD